ncbi:hypothetical protein A2U01_0089340, partial [Trifolium medium]|nr:hypothetical protein [Trifolium medium]
VLCGGSSEFLVVVVVVAFCFGWNRTRVLTAGVLFCGGGRVLFPPFGGDCDGSEVEVMGGGVVAIDLRWLTESDLRWGWWWRL